MDSDDFVPFVTNPPATFDPNELSSSAVFQPLITDVRAPWMQFSGGESDYGSSSSSLVRLHNEILSFCEYTAPTKVTFAASGARNIITTSDRSHNVHAREKWLLGNKYCVKLLKSSSKFGEYAGIYILLEQNDDFGWSSPYFLFL